jgi:hypothetical protein
MKIYIEDNNNTILKNLASNKKKLHTIEKYLVDKKITNKIYSNYGFFHTNDNKIYSTKIITDNVYKKKIICEKNEINLIIDNSKLEKQIVFQIPYEHVCIPLLIHSYVNSINKNLKLVIENLYSMDDITPTNFYFEYSLENNIIPIEDINNFLLLLVI